ncbi:MAG: LysR family transcriptional regulator [Actinomycetes bacterium]|jgi:DNA-binding transcriptional LysR family regulator|nr:LysR family transcriptional regulator [Actinomycetes bacterium]
MNNTQLRSFVTVVELGSFSRAAHKLSLSQPAITMQVRALEDELGAALLERKYRKVDLTDAGALLLPRAKEMLAIEEKAIDELTELSGGVRGSLRVAASTTPGDYIIPPLLGRFVEQYPDVGVAIEVASTQETVAALDAGEADVGVCGARITGRKVDYEECGHDELVPIAPAGHPLTECKKLTVKALVGERWVMRNAESGTQRSVKRILDAAGVDMNTLQAMVELDTGEGVVAAVEGGLGIAVVSRYVADKALQLGTVAELQLTGRPWKRPFWLAFPHKSLSRAAASFADFCRDNMR